VSDHPLLLMSLEAAVPLAIAECGQRGGPTARDSDEARAFAAVLAEKGDQLLYGGRDCAAVWAGLVRALAVLAYAPGGVHLLQAHWQAAP
jgi:hypothetical protein